ncbi:MAG: hypothetical protein FWD25_04170 [Clostridia bacterium]|nr:hypothetical protein [Clostridia bacterium]
MKKSKLSPFLIAGILLAPLYLITDRYIVKLPEWAVITIVAVQLACVILGVYFTFRKDKSKKETETE